MGKDKGRSNRPLPDLTIHPDPEPMYEPPPAYVCKCDTFPVSVTETTRLHVRIAVYRGLVVDFSINQTHVDDDGTEVEVARIDTTNGTVHRHQFIASQPGHDIYGHRLIRRIPADGGWQVVHDEYEKAFDSMIEEHQDNERRWRDG